MSYTRNGTPLSDQVNFDAPLPQVGLRESLCDSLAQKQQRRRGWCFSIFR
jgi:hypothetical protein